MSEHLPAKLPGLSAVSTGNAALDRWIQAATERFEVREGARGSDLERVVTQRDLREYNFIRGSDNGGGGGRSGGVLVQGSDGNFTSMSVEAFGDEIRKTKLYQHLMTRLDDPARFDGLPEKVRALLLVDLANEAAKNGAAVTEIDYKYQSATESLAYKVDTVTAAVADAQAGVRQTAFASATSEQATAGLITQIVASLGNYYQDGTPGRVNIETSLVAVADRVTGLSAEWMVKLNAGGAVAGIGLSATEDPTGATKSAFIVAADAFGLVGTVVFSQATTPTAASIGQTWYNTTTKLYYRATATGTGSWALYTPVVPFGVDTVTNTTYINGNVRISAGGATIADSIGVPGPTGATGATGATGSTGGTGSAGARGSVTRYTTGTWNGTDSSYISLFPESTLVVGDTLTAGNGDSPITRYWGGSSWTNPGVIIDGSLLVTGSVMAGSLQATNGSVGVTIAGSTPRTNAAGIAMTNGLAVYQSSSLLASYMKNAQAGSGCSSFESNGGWTIESKNVGTEGFASAGVFKAAGNFIANNGGSLYVGAVRSASGAATYAAYASTGSYGPFTGSHDALIEKEAEIALGDIAVDASVARKRGFSDTLMVVEKSSRPRQKGAIGVVIGRGRVAGLAAFLGEDGQAVPEETQWNETHDCLGVNALGEGQLNVCGEGGDLEIGDLIVTSSVPGKGMRQADDLVRSTTVAKCRENVSFSSPTEVKTVACIYLCG